MKDIRIEVATVVFYDGVEAYTTHRALFVDCTDKMKLTTKSQKALKKEIEIESGCEILKVDFNGQMYSGAVDFMQHCTEVYRCEDSEVAYIKEKFVEYFVSE